MVKEKTIEEKNIYYFQSLANSRASLKQLKISTAALLVMGIILPMFYNEIEIGRKIYTIPFYIFITLTILLVFIAFSSLFEKMLYKFQIFFSYILTIFIGILISGIMGLGYFLAIANYTEGAGFIAPNKYTKLIFYIGIVSITAYLIVNIVLLYYRLRMGYSDKRINKNFLAASFRKKSGTIWIIFGVVMIASQIFTQGKYIINIIGIISLTILGPAFSSPLVEFFYLAYLKTKSEKYFEKRPKIIPIKFDEKQKLRNRIIIWGYIALSILYFYLIDNIYGDRTYPIIIRIFGLLILISYVILLSAWIIKKIKERKNK